jgi:hypothetical protein
MPEADLQKFIDAWMRAGVFIVALNMIGTAVLNALLVLGLYLIMSTTVARPAENQNIQTVQAPRTTADNAREILKNQGLIE